MFFLKKKQKLILLKNIRDFDHFKVKVIYHYKVFSLSVNKVFFYHSRHLFNVNFPLSLSLFKVKFEQNSYLLARK